MRYAIFSDIHGNIHALQAALSHAEAQGADRYLFLGDYYRECPWPNEVAEVVRNQKSSVVIRGNNEEYLIDLGKQDQSQWTHEQFKPVYWNYRTLTQENLKYLTALPKSAVICDAAGTIHLSHTLNVFFRSPKIPYFGSMGFRMKMEEGYFTHEEYLASAKEAVLSCPGAVADIRALPQGVYLFGHAHLQFHMEYEGRLFINPGSCGAALDFDTTAAYTILESAKGGWVVAEQRVKYNLDAVMQGMRNSDFAADSPVWSQVLERQVATSKDCIGPFLRHVMTVAKELGETNSPVGNDVWEMAVQSWDMDLFTPRLP